MRVNWIAVSSVKEIKNGWYYFKNGKEICIAYVYNSELSGILVQAMDGYLKLNDARMNGFLISAEAVELPKE